jgi:RNA polymerase sigma factor (TIGR02999 family)
MALVYAELHRMARRYMARQRPGHTFQPTALIHEAYLRLAGGSRPRFVDRSHFFAVAATAMRQVLVDYARARLSEKRGGSIAFTPLDDTVAVSTGRLAEIAALDESLSALEALHPRQSRIVELRYFGGLTVEETAGVLRVSRETVLRDWRAAKAWLHRELARQPTRA